ncbi:MAG: hypothetical protein GY820_38710 [Gammaproteobacteria bacterium]|nr:hypothetical protein [Gammaproteobacteria bacterium]
MNEHEQEYNTETVKAGVRQDDELYRWIVAAYERSKKALETLGVFDDAEKYAKVYDDGAWGVLETLNRPDHLSKVDIHLAFDVIETGLAVATSRPPAPDVDAKFGLENPEYQKIVEMRQSDDALEQEQAEKMLEGLKERMNEYSASQQRELVDIWKRTGMHGKSQRLYREMGKTGDGILKSVFDQETNEFKNIETDLMSHYPSPNCDSIAAHADEKEPYIFATVMSVDRVREIYGIDGIDKAAIGEHDELKIFKHSTAGYRARIQAAVKSALSFGKQENQGNHVIVLECYMPDDGQATVDIDLPDFGDDEIQKVDDDGKPETKKGQRKQFASGFKIVTIVLNHQGWIVDERENQYRDGRPPFFKKTNYQQLGAFHGTSEVKHIFDLIVRVCQGVSSASDNVKYTGNPALLLGQGTKAHDGGPVTNSAGLILDSPTGTDRYMEPPRLGGDYKYLIELYMRLINQISRLDSAIRGVNENASDSGKKVRELRQAATGLFQPKLDEEVRWAKELFDHWAYCLQNLYQGPILQKVDDVNGIANYEEFIPSEGRGIGLSVSVSTDSILPSDIWSEWDEALTLYNLVLADGVTRLITPEMVIDAAPTFTAKQGAKTHVGAAQEKIDFEKQKMQAFEQLQEIAPMASEISEREPGGPEEDEINQQLIQIIQSFPEFLRSDEFQALPERLKLAIVGEIAQLGQGDANVEG